MRRSELIERLDSWKVKVRVYVRPDDPVMSVKPKWFFEEARLWQTYRRSNKPSNFLSSAAAAANSQDIQAKQHRRC